MRRCRTGSAVHRWGAPPQDQIQKSSGPRATIKGVRIRPTRLGLRVRVVGALAAPAMVRLKEIGPPSSGSRSSSIRDKNRGASWEKRRRARRRTERCQSPYRSARTVEARSPKVRALDSIITSDIEACADRPSGSGAAVRTGTSPHSPPAVLLASDSLASKEANDSNPRPPEPLQTKEASSTVGVREVGATAPTLSADLQPDSADPTTSIVFEAADRAPDEGEAVARAEEVRTEPGSRYISV